jgi:hypothetical protein
MSYRTCFLRALSGLFCLGVAGTFAGGMLTGCGVAPASGAFGNCTVKEGILPATAVASHTAAAPGNQQAFEVSFVSPCGLPLPALTPQGFTWASSDPVNAPISNVAATAGVATCVGATTVPVTISVSPNGYGAVEVATLTCQ